MKNIELLHQAITASGNEQVERLIKQFILSNELQVKSKFNLFDCVAKKDNYRPVMTAVHYENGFAYATDGHIAIKLKQDYAPELEGKTINKKGEELKDTYPNVDACTPKDENLTYLGIDFARVLELEKIYKLDYKADTKIIQGCIKIGEAFVNIPLLAKIARFAISLDIKTIGVENSQKALKITNGESTAIIMPVMFNEESEAHKLYAL